MAQTTSEAVVIIPGHINVTVNAYDANGPLDSDDFGKLKNWKSGREPTIPGKPWKMILSLPPGTGGDFIQASFKISHDITDKAISIRCHFFVSRLGGPFVEDKPKLQVGVGTPVTCLYNIQFPVS